MLWRAPYPDKMFRTPTVVILGAGANCELGLPLGKDLMTRVEASLRFGERITDNARELRDLEMDLWGLVGSPQSSGTKACSGDEHVSLNGRGFALFLG